MFRLLWLFYVRLIERFQFGKFHQQVLSACVLKFNFDFDAVAAPFDAYHRAQAEAFVLHAAANAEWSGAFEPRLVGGAGDAGGRYFSE